MRQRCLNSESKHYQHYGGRGISVCDRWRRFELFYADMGDPPAGKSLGRIDNDGDYSPENCRWETIEQQANNTRQSVRITIDGKTRTVAQWARRVGIDPKVIRARIASGWRPVDAVLTPQRHLGDGELHHRARLTESIVREIMARQGDGSAALAREYDVSPKSIRDIWNGKTWRKVTGL